MMQHTFCYFVILILLYNVLVIKSSSPVNPGNKKKVVEVKWQFGQLLNSIANVNKQRLDALMTYAKLDDKYNAVTDGILRMRRERDPIVAVIFLYKSDPAITKLYEIYDSDLNYVPSDTPVRDVLHKIKNYYVTEQDKNDEADNLEKLSYPVERKGTVEDLNDGEEIIPAKNNIQDQKDGEEIVNKRGRSGNMQSEKAIGINVNNKVKNNNLETNTKQILRGLFKSCTKKVTKACKKACVRASKDTCNTYKCSSSMKRSFKRNCRRECKSKFREDSDNKSD